MSKAVITFTLPDEQEDLDLALKGYKFKFAMQDLDNYLRGMLKYQQLTTEQVYVYEKIRSKIHEILDKRDDDLND
jgi:hypothetical protein